MTEKPICGANKSDGTVCRAAQGWGTSHPGSGRCKFHGGSSPNGEKFAARAAVMAMASGADAEPSEVLLKAIRCDWGAVTYVQERLAEINGRMLEAQDNPEKIYAATQQMGMWQEMYGDWVDRAAKHAKMALDAGVQERQVRLAEMTGALFAEAIRGILQGLKLSPAQQAAAPELVRTHCWPSTPSSPPRWRPRTTSRTPWSRPSGTTTQIRSSAHSWTTAARCFR